MPPLTQVRMSKKDRSALVSLREKMIDYWAKLDASGWKFTAYRCNHCRHLIPTKCPKPEDVSSKGFWDSTTQCLSCGGLNFVLIHPSGRTEARSFADNSVTLYRHVPVKFEIISKVALKT